MGKPTTDQVRNWAMGALEEWLQGYTDPNEDGVQYKFGLYGTGTDSLIYHVTEFPHRDDAPPQGEEADFVVRVEVTEKANE